MSIYDPPGTQRPMPVVTSLSAPFWEACRRDELLYQRCVTCSTVAFPPEQVCAACLSMELTWERSAGLGTVYSYSNLHREPSAGFPLPSVFAIVDLDEGYCMFTSIVDCEATDVAIDMRVEVVFDPQTEEISLPMFRPVTGGPARRLSDG